ncbi:MAG: CDP-alcohol phosphatidyltransferase family protein [Bacteroidales bacterium]|nr:CDP-alcohol phosphatidyltransferase family protein [Bacteroidales bacterium]
MNLVKHIPNTITLASLCLGAAAVTCIFAGETETAVYCVLAAAVCDFCDGFAARLLHAASPIGKELDSLADMVSFGLVPALMMFRMLQQAWSGCGLISGDPSAIGATGWWLSLPAVLIAAASALRLAKFNIDTRQATSFIGLPTPAATLLVCALFMTKTDSRVLWAGLLDSPCFLLICTAAIAWLLVSPIPMFSLKLKSFRIKDNLWIYTFLLISAGLLVWAGIPGFAAVIVLYIALSCLQAVSAR